MLGFLALLGMTAQESASRRTLRVRREENPEELKSATLYDSHEAYSTNCNFSFCLLLRGKHGSTEFLALDYGCAD